MITADSILLLRHLQQLHIPPFPPALRAAAGVMDRPGAADYDVGKRGGWDSDKDGNVATLPPPTDTGAQPYVNLIAAY